MNGTCVIRTVLFGALIACALPAAPQERPAADNTKVNKRDRSPGEQTADQGKNNSSDLDLMKQIRKAVVDDKSLSTSAHNVKIIAKNGKVTLKGPVTSEDEKKAVEQKATEVAGAGNVTNQITIKAARNKKKSDGGQ